MHFTANKKVLAYYQTFENVGRFEPSEHCYQCQRGQRDQGDVLCLSICLDPTCEHIIAGCYQVHGSLFAMACCAYAIEQLTNQPVKQLAALKLEQFQTALALPPERLHCALQVLDVCAGLYRQLGKASAASSPLS